MLIFIIQDLDMTFGISNLYIFFLFVAINTIHILD